MKFKPSNQRKAMFAKMKGKLYIHKSNFGSSAYDIAKDTEGKKYAIKYSFFW